MVGVSWYEAAAYAAYAGKSLPTYYHWYQAAALGVFSDILLLSNFSGKGLAQVGEYQGLGAYGTFDMAGNAKEWCLNSTGSRRYILGGAWNEPSYMFTDRDAQDPFGRQPELRIPLREIPSGTPGRARGAGGKVAARLLEGAARERRGVRIYQSLFTYDRTPLNATVEALADDSPILAPGEDHRGRGLRQGARPALISSCPATQRRRSRRSCSSRRVQAFTMRSSAYLETRQVQFLIQSGRAVLYPIYRGTFDRWIEVRASARTAT